MVMVALDQMGNFARIQRADMGHWAKAKRKQKGMERKLIEIVKRKQGLTVLLSQHHSLSLAQAYIVRLTKPPRSGEGNLRR